MLGTLLGHPELVTAHLDWMTTEPRVFLERIPSVPDLQSAWVLLLCCAVRATYCESTLPTDAVARFADEHDEGVEVHVSIVQRPARPGRSHEVDCHFASRLGRIGALEHCPHQTSRWASWADCLPMIGERQPELAEDLLLMMEGGANTPALSAAREEALTLTGVMGFTPPSCQEERSLQIGNQKILNQARREGVGNTKLLLEWSSRSEKFTCSPLLPGSGRALVRSQSVTGSGPLGLGVTQQHLHAHRAATSAFSYCAAFESLPFSRRFCQCDRSLDAFGHHRATCSRAGVLGRRVESAPARSCREAGGRVTTNVRVRDLDVTVPNALDGLRLKVVGTGCPRSERPSWQCTRRWCHSFTPTNLRTVMLPTRMAQSWPPHDAGRNAYTTNSWDLKAGFGWSSWLWKQRVGGLMRRWL